MTKEESELLWVELKKIHKKLTYITILQSDHRFKLLLKELKGQSQLR